MEKVFCRCCIECFADGQIWWQQHFRGLWETDVRRLGATRELVGLRPMGMKCYGGATPRDHHLQSHATTDRVRFARVTLKRQDRDDMHEGVVSRDANAIPRTFR